MKIETLHLPQVNEYGISLSIARADLIHPLASGNKWYKLKPQLDFAKKNNIKQIISFGGAYSNHIHALALMAKEYQIKTHGIIRGELTSVHNPTLNDAKNAEMTLEFVSRHEYRNRNNPEFLQALQTRFPNALIIPEGGASEMSVNGCIQLANDINNQIDTNVIAVACGTGSTLAGISCGLKKGQKAVGYAVVNDKSLSSRIASLVESCIDDSKRKTLHYEIIQAEFGGYAKVNDQIFKFILSFLDLSDILLDPVYTAKMCYQLLQDINNGRFQYGTHITLVHTGGLQGWRGMKDRLIKATSEEAWEKIEKKLKNTN